MVSVRSTSQSGTSDSFGSSCTIPVPSGATSGDIVVLLVEQWESGNPTITWPTGFQASQLFEIVSGSQKFKGNWKRLTASDAGNYVPAWTGSQWNMGHAVCIQDALASGDPIDDVDVSTTTNANEATVTNNLSTTALQIHAIAKENAQLQTTTPSGFAEQRDGDYLTTNTRVAPGSGSQSASGGVLAGSTLQLAALIGIKPAAGGGATDLVIQDASVASVADNAVLTRIIDLAIQDMVSATTAEPLNLGQIHQLAIFDAVVPSTAENMVLSTGVTLTIQKATVATSADGFPLVQTHNLQIQDATVATKADTIALVPPGTGGFMSVTDVQLQKLATLTGMTGSIQDLEHAYYSSLSGLVPAASFSVQDHQRAYWEAQTGLTGRSLADLEKAFYDSQLIAAGSLSDREFTYWVSV